MFLVKFYRISFLQKTAGRLLLVSSNISGISVAQSAVLKQLTVFVSKIFKIAKVEGNIICG